MSDPLKPSFSTSRRWISRLNLVLAVAALAALLLMANYLAGGYYLRFHLANQDILRLSPQTVRILKSITNHVDVTLFFDTENEMEIHNLSSALLQEYKNICPANLTIRTLDYTHAPGEAKEFLARHNLTALSEKNFVLFESGAHWKLFYARDLGHYDLNPVLTGQSRTIRRDAFQGELLFSSAIFAVCNPQPFKAYFLEGHDESNPNKTYSKFANILSNELDTAWSRLSLAGTNTIPTDCLLLIIAGPRLGFLPSELEKIDTYLRKGGPMGKGGRALLLVNDTIAGIDDILAKWDIRVSTLNVRERDTQYCPGNNGSDLLAARLAAHPILNPIKNENLTSIEFCSPKSFIVANTPQTPGAPEIRILASTSEKADNGREQGMFPLAVAIEQGSIRGVGGGTRIVALADTTMFTDPVINGPTANHLFAQFTLNWLMDRPDILLSGLGPRPIQEYKLVLTEAQIRTAQLIYLIMLPGAILLLGGLVYLKRRS